MLFCGITRNQTDLTWSYKLSYPSRLTIFQLFDSVLSCFTQVLVEIPYIFAQTIVYCLIVYAMIGFEWTATKFFWYTFFQFCCLLYMTFYGMMTVAITPNANIAAIVAASFYGFFNLFSGFIIPRPVSFLTLCVHVRIN